MKHIIGEFHGSEKAYAEYMKMAVKRYTGHKPILTEKAKEYALGCFALSWFSYGVVLAIFMSIRS